MWLVALILTWREFVTWWDGVFLAWWGHGSWKTWLDVDLLENFTWEWFDSWMDDSMMGWASTCFWKKTRKSWTKRRKRRTYGWYFNAFFFWHFSLTCVDDASLLAWINGETKAEKTEREKTCGKLLLWWKLCGRLERNVMWKLQWGEKSAERWENDGVMRVDAVDSFWYLFLLTCRSMKLEKRDGNVVESGGCWMNWIMVLREET